MIWPADQNRNIHKSCYSERGGYTAVTIETWLDAQVTMYFIFFPDFTIVTQVHVAFRCPPSPFLVALACSWGRLTHSVPTEKEDGHTRIPRSLVRLRVNEA